MRLPSKLLVFGRTTIHFCFCHQVNWQEYSELGKSAFLALSASAIGKNGQLGISRNSEYLFISYRRPTRKARSVTRGELEKKRLMDFTEKRRTAHSLCHLYFCSG
jgi:hypothetical protein